MKEYIESYKQLDLFKDINTQIKNKTFSHSHLILCEDDFSAKAFSYLVALTLFCEKNEPCLTCPNCLKMIAETHADYFVFPKGKNFAVSDSEEVIEKAYTRPINSDKKVFMLNDFDNSNVASQNKILKILEEPTASTYFILNAKNSKKILPTIKSRTQIHSVPAFSKELLRQILKQNKFDYSDRILSFSDGYLGKAISLGENKDFFKSYDFVLSVLSDMKTSKDIIRFNMDLADKNSFVLKLEIFERVLRNMLVLKSGKNNILNDIDILSINDFEKDFSINAILKILQKVIEAKMYFDSNVNLNTISDNFLLGLLEVKYLWK